ncbi:cytochrome c4 [Nitrosomonas sp.]|uniref:c-type cytochrome n=1 Tax=Nitrosomonas sp. TaxID=42353 RepID=UPI00330683BC
MKFIVFILLAMGSGLINAQEPVSPLVPDTLEQRVKPCTICHGDEDRAGRDAYYPRIAGKPAGYLFNQLRNFRDGRRYYQAMAILLENLSDEYLLEIAHYFSSLKYPYPEAAANTLSPEETQTVETLIHSGDPERDIPACSACHGKALMGVKPFIPSLLGLPHAYVAAQFGGWRNGGSMRGQIPDCMSEIARKLSQEEVNALTVWLPAQPITAEPAETEILTTELTQRCQTTLSGEGFTR